MTSPKPGRVDPDRPHFRPPLWREGLPVALWALAIAFWAQFALASADELEPQAALLGWVLVAILLVGGLALWGASLHNRRRPPD